MPKPPTTFREIEYAAKPRSVCIRAWIKPSRKSFHIHFEKLSTRRNRDKTWRAATGLSRAESARRFALDPRTF